MKNNKKKNRFIAALIMIASALALIYGGMLIYRALMIMDNTGNIWSGIFSVLLAAVTIVLTFKFVGEAGSAADNGVKNKDFRTPLNLILSSVAGTLLAIHFSGLGIPGFINWIFNGFQMQ